MGIMKFVRSGILNIVGIFLDLILVVQLQDIKIKLLLKLGSLELYIVSNFVDIDFNECIELKLYFKVEF